MIKLSCSAPHAIPELSPRHITCCTYCFTCLSEYLKRVATVILFTYSEFFPTKPGGRVISYWSSYMTWWSSPPPSGPEHYSVSDQYGHAAPRPLHHGKHPEDWRLQLRPHHLLLRGRPEGKTDHRQLPRVSEETAARCAQTRGDWQSNANARRKVWTLSALYAFVQKNLLLAANKNPPATNTLSTFTAA